MTNLRRERREELHASTLDDEGNPESCTVCLEADELRALLRDSAWRERVERQLGDVARYLEGHSDYAETETDRGVMIEAARRIRATVDTGDEEGEG